MNSLEKMEVDMTKIVKKNKTTKVRKRDWDLLYDIWI